MVLYAFAILALAGMAWIRFAPSDPAVWHIDPKVTANQDLATGVRRRVAGTDATLQALHQIILETPRTELLHGSPQDGHVTYVTRSRWMGFPDYTTLMLNDSNIELWARQRFGQSDHGVNRNRVDAWLSVLQGVS